MHVWLKEVSYGRNIRSLPVVSLWKLLCRRKSSSTDGKEHSSDGGFLNTRSKPSVYHAVVVIFLEFFAWGLLTMPTIQCLSVSFIFFLTNILDQYVVYDDQAFFLTSTFLKFPLLINPPQTFPSSMLQRRCSPQNSEWGKSAIFGGNAFGDSGCGRNVWSPKIDAALQKIYETFIFNRDVQNLIFTYVFLASY